MALFPDFGMPVIIIWVTFPGSNHTKLSEFNRPG